MHKQTGTGAANGNRSSICVIELPPHHHSRTKAHVYLLHLLTTTFKAEECRQGQGNLHLECIDQMARVRCN